MYTRIKITTAVVFLLFTWMSCRNESTLSSDIHTERTIRIEGFLEGGQGQTVLIEEMGARVFIPIDTVRCDDTGTFDISISPEATAFYVLRYGEAGYVTLLMGPGEEIEFTGSYSSKDSYEIKGSTGSELLLKLSLEHKNVLNELGKITRKNMELVSSPDYAAIKPVLDHQFDSITNGFYQYSVKFIRENSGSLAILVALYNLYGQGLPVFYPHKDLHIYQFVDSALMSNYNGFEAVELLHAQILEAEQAMKDEGLVPKLQKGEIAPDFVSSRTDGSQLALSELRGDYVLLSFWAGWSRLSRDENTTLKRAFETYGEYQFRILQVSFDDNRKVWTDAIMEDGLEWDHVSELMRWETPVADLYHIDKIPCNVLIDPAGTIVDTDLFGEKLFEKLELIFTK